MAHSAAFSTYLIRASRDGAGVVTGTIVRVRSGDRIPFRDIEDAARVLARLLAADLGAPGGRGRPEDAPAFGDHESDQSPPTRATDTPRS